MFKLDLQKAEEPEIKLPTSIESQKKQESSRKTSTYALLTTPQPLMVWIKIKWKILNKMGIPGHLTCLLRNLYASQEETVPEMEQWTSCKLGKEYVKTAYCHPAYLTYMQSTSCRSSQLGAWVGKIPQRREWLPTPVFWPEEVHGLYSPQGHKELVRTE